MLLIAAFVAAFIAGIYAMLPASLDIHNIFRPSRAC